MSVRDQEIARFRFLLSIVAVVFPFWGMINQYLKPDLLDPDWIRFVLSGIFLLSFFVCRSPKASPNLKAAFYYTALWSFVTHYAGIVVANNADNYLIPTGYVILIATILLHPSRKSTYAFMTFVAALTVIGWGYIGWDDAHVKMVAFGVAMRLVIIGLIKHHRLATAETLERTEQKQSVLLDNLTEGVILMRADGQIESVNPAALNILRRTRDSLVNQSAWPTIPARAINEKGEPLHKKDYPGFRAIQTGQPQLNKVTGLVNSDDSVIWLKTNAMPIFKADAEAPYGVVLSFQDISEQKRTEALIKDQQERLAETAKLSALGEMAAGIAHEINNPLMVISGRAKQIAKRATGGSTDAQDKIIEFAANIEKMVDRISKIVKGLRTFARNGEEDPFTTNNINQIVDETLALCRERFTKNQVDLNISLPETGPTIECRPGQVSQVILNLLQNAVDAVADQSEKRVALKVSEKVGSVEIVIEDSGPGIPETIRHRILEPFFTTKEVGKGTGLGLSISKGIVDSHKGVFSIENAQKGVRFVIRLPRTQSEVEKLAA